MGQTNSIILKVSDDSISANDRYYAMTRQHLDMIYKINNYKYQFAPSGCIRTSLVQLDDKPKQLTHDDPEVKFIRVFQDGKIWDVPLDERKDIETNLADLTDTDYRATKTIKLITRTTGDYDFRVVIC